MQFFSGIRTIGLTLSLFSALAETNAQTHRIGKPRPKINIFEQEQYKPPPIICVPKKVNLFEQNQSPQLITLQIKPEDKNIKPPFELSIDEDFKSVFPELGETVNFCGETIPLHFPLVRTRLNRELGRYKKAGYTVRHYQARHQYYKAEALAIIQKYQLPDELIYLAVAESGLANVTSPKGAKGFWQFMPETAKNYGLEVTETVDERLDPLKSAEAACRYLRFLYSKFKSWSLAAAAYNMGEGGLENAMKTQAKGSYYELSLNPETAQYLFRIVTLKYIMEYPRKMGFETRNMPEKYKIKTRKEVVNYSIPDLKSFAQECGTNYETLKYLNPWLIADQLNAKSGKNYEICLPIENSIVGND